MNNTYYLLAGGYSSFIHVYSFDSHSGALRFAGVSPVIEQPSYLCMSRDQSLVYAVSELQEGGSVQAYSFDRQQGGLTLLNKRMLAGSGACFVALSKVQQHLVVACYRSGSLLVHSLKEGVLGPMIQQIQDSGHSINPSRQNRPHVHATCWTPDSNYIFYTDLGTDRIYGYTYDPALGQPMSFCSVLSLSPGSGPRHLLFSRNGDFLYVITELSGEIMLLRQQQGQLELIQTVSMLQEGSTGEAGGGDIRLSADGRFLYASNRGDANELIVFAVCPLSGELTIIQRRFCMGKSPRNLCIDPSGQYLLITNQESNTIAVFKLDPFNGRIGRPVFVRHVFQPSCLNFAY